MGGGVEALAAPDPGELDGAENISPLLVVADDAGFAAQGAFNGQVDHRADEALVGGVGGGGAGEVAAFLDQGLLGPYQLGELLAEPLTDVDSVQLVMAEGVLGHDLAAAL